MHEGKLGTRSKSIALWRIRRYLSIRLLRLYTRGSIQSRSVINCCDTPWTNATYNYDVGVRGDPLPITIAYLILAHGNPDQLARLVAALPNNSPVLIHFDLRADLTLYRRSVELLCMRPRLEFVKRHACRWGAFGIVKGTISLMQTLVAKKIDFDYVTLLSGSDYPIKSNSEIAIFLERNRGKEFIEFFLVTAPNRWSDHGGYYKDS